MRFGFAAVLPVAAVVLGLGSGSAGAVPAGAGVEAQRSAAAAETSVENVYWVRQCHRVGRWHRRVVCRNVWVQPRRHILHKRHRRVH